MKTHFKYLNENKIYSSGELAELSNKINAIYIELNAQIRINKDKNLVTFYKKAQDDLNKAIKNIGKAIDYLVDKD